MILETRGVFFFTLLVVNCLRLPRFLHRQLHLTLKVLNHPSLKRLLLTCNPHIRCQSFFGTLPGSYDRVASKGLNVIPTRC
ncbi:hypothetical protein DL98DRAFT_515087 [Cadophora sp. DSE1049]|nr:hypothetical protein DL98DRAFT_515087 [Cadophora sp. DSE1049]